MIHLTSSFLNFALFVMKKLKNFQIFADPNKNKKIKINKITHKINHKNKNKIMKYKGVN